MTKCTFQSDTTQGRLHAQAPSDNNITCGATPTGGAWAPDRRSVRNAHPARGMTLTVPVVPISWHTPPVHREYNCGRNKSDVSTRRSDALFGVDRDVTQLRVGVHKHRHKQDVACLQRSRSRSTIRVTISHVILLSDGACARASAPVSYLTRRYI